MNAVGIDVSKGKSTIAVMKPFGEVVIAPFEVSHTELELKNLVKILNRLKGDTRIVIEFTGNYYKPIADTLCKAGFYVSVVNAILVHDYKNNSLRRVKTDKKDSIKLANYAIDSWNELQQYYIEEDARCLLKNYYHQYEQYTKLHTMLNNNLTSLLDMTFPGINRLFSSHSKISGADKWVDFVEKYYHNECVTSISKSRFCKQYETWCDKRNYRYSEKKAIMIYDYAKNCISTLPNDKNTKVLVGSAVKELKSINYSLATIRDQMNRIAATLPEYPVVMNMYGVGPSLGPQLIAEIGDVRRFHSKKALIAYAGIDAQPYQSGSMDVKSCSISKRGSSSLRHTLFIIMKVYLQNAPDNEPVYQFMKKKKEEGKPFKVYMMASANKFLRRYYATVKAYLKDIEEN